MRKFRIIAIVLFLSFMLNSAPVMAYGSTSLTLPLGTMQSLYCGLHYNDGYNKSWVSSNSSIASVVSNNGATCIIQLKSLGTCYIYFSTRYKKFEIIDYDYYGYPIFGYREYADDFTYYITVTNSGTPEPGTISIGDSLALKPGERWILNPTVKSMDNHYMYNYNQIKWSSSNNAVATVNEIGLVTARANGSAVITASTPAGVKGTATVTVSSPSTYINISTAQQLNSIRNNLSGNYILTKNIIFSDSDFSSGGAFYNGGEGFIPIDGFSGTLNGNGFCIENLHSNGTNAGLFTDLKGNVKNLEIKGSSITGTNSAGAFYAAGVNPVLINCKSTGNVITGNNAGGFGGNNSNSVSCSMCTNTSTVNGSLNSGGLVGSAGAFSNFLLCSNKGSVNSNFIADVGGIFGYGGMACSLKYCSNEGPISGISYTGGLVGLSGVYSRVYCSYNIGKVTGKASTALVGGIGGKGYTSYIADSYNAGALELNGGYPGIMGGILGTATDLSYYAGENALMLNNCINIGTMTLTGGGLPQVGGIVGTITGLQPLDSQVVAKNCYYLSTLCPAGIAFLQYGSTDRLLPLTAAQMKSAASLSGLDFSWVWTINSGNAYPKLRFQDQLSSSIQVISLIGSSRYDTAVKLSQSQFLTSDTVIIVNGGAMADGLGATPLAAYKKAPLLLTDVISLPTTTINEIKRLKAKNVIIVGGTGIVSDNVKKQLQALGLTVGRISGINRYDTSLEVAKYIDKNCYDVSKIVIANGNGEADALSVASAAGRDHMPIILVEKDSIETAAYNWLASENIADAYIIGGSGVVSDNVLNKIDAITSANVKNNRLGGHNRFETNSLIIDKFYGSYINKTYIAKGYLLIDALAAGPVAAINGAPVVLSGTDLDISQKTVLGKRYGDTLIKTGGGISDTAVNSLINCLK